MLKTPFAVAVGTPNRILKLIEAGALDLSRCRFIMIDSYKDAKNFSVLDWPDTRDDVAKLFTDVFRPRVVEGSTKFAVV